MLLVLIFVCKRRAGPGLMSDSCSPATGRGEPRCQPMGPLPGGWLHDPSRSWEYFHLLTAALGFLKPCSLLHFFLFLLISRGRCESLSNLLPPSAISFPDTVHACNKTSTSSLAGLSFPGCPCPHRAHSCFLNTVMVFQPPVPLVLG